MKKLLFLIALAACAALRAFAADTVVLNLWEEMPAPVANGITEAEDNRNPRWISNVSEPTVTIFPADKPNGTALLMCPGGGYAGLAFTHEGTDFAKLLNPLGITVAVLKYRMPNGHHQVPADDARRALQLLHEHADEWGINPARIGIGGASAGGHLASTVATHCDETSPAPAFQMLLYPVITMNEKLTHKGSRENLLGDDANEELTAYYSNELQVGTNTPPAFISTSADDDIVALKNSFDYFDSLTAKGVAATMHIYPGGGHGWGCRENFRYHEQWLRDLSLWLSSLW